MTSTKSIMILLAGFFLSGCQQQEVNVALGTLEMDRYLVTAPQSETLVTLDVKEGQEVKKVRVSAGWTVRWRRVNLTVQKRRWSEPKLAWLNWKVDLVKRILLWPLHG